MPDFGCINDHGDLIKTEKPRLISYWSTQVNHTPSFLTHHYPLLVMTLNSPIPPPLPKLRFCDVTHHVCHEPPCIASQCAPQHHQPGQNSILFCTPDMSEFNQCRHATHVSSRSGWQKRGVLYEIAAEHVQAGAPASALTYSASTSRLQLIWSAHRSEHGPDLQRETCLKDEEVAALWQWRGVRKVHLHQ